MRRTTQIKTESQIAGLILKNINKQPNFDKLINLQRE